MAIVKGGTKIDGGIVKRALYWFNTESGTPSYIHLKTNMIKGNSCMAMVEAVGYNYGNAKPIKCAWTWYNYSGDQSAPYSVGLKNYYTGLSADGVYFSSDGYTVLRAYASSQYFVGFILNSVTANPVGIYDISITAANQNSNSGSYY